MGLRRLWLLAVVALTCAGCLRSTTTIAVDDDGSGTAEVVVAVNGADAANRIQGAVPTLPDLPGLPDRLPGVSRLPADADEVCARMNEATLRLPAGASAGPYRAGDYCGQRITFAFRGPAELSLALATLSAQARTEAVLQRDGDDWVFDAPVLKPLDLLDVAALALPDDVIAQIQAQSEAIYHVTLPGHAIDSNADVEEDGTFSWTVTPDRPQTRLQARSGPLPTPPAAGRPLVAILAGAGAVIVVLAAGATGLVWRRRRRASARSDPPGGPGSGPVEPPGVPAPIGAPPPPTYRPH